MYVHCESTGKSGGSLRAHRNFLVFPLIDEKRGVLLTTDVISFPGALICGCCTPRLRAGVRRWR